MPRPCPPRRARFRLLVSRIASAALGVACALVGEGRASPASSPRDVLRAASRAVVALVVADRHGGASLCSGVLVESDLVLTARHCVAKGAVLAPACDALGRSRDGDQLDRDASPDDIAVHAGGAVDPSAEPRARAVRVITAGGRVLCDADVAYVVLDRSLDDLPRAALGGDPPSPGDTIATIGYGGGADARAGHLAARPPGRVLAVGPAADRSTGKVLGPREIEVESATCAGDSGGPAIDLERGLVVGVVSRGAGCSPAGNHVATRIDAFGELTARARAAAISMRSGAASGT